MSRICLLQIILASVLVTMVAILSACSGDSNSNSTRRIHKTATATAAPVPTTTITPAPTATATPRPTATPTPVPTTTPTPVPTTSPTPVPTASPTPAPTVSPTPVPTASPTPTVTPTPTPTPTSLACPNGFRTFKITNGSPQTIWLGANSGAQPAPATGCGAGDTCSVPGTACSPLSSPPNCYYVATNPGENVACSKLTDPCPTGQSCNTSLGLCQWQLQYDYSNSCSTTACPSGETCDAALHICLKSSYTIPNDELEISPGGHTVLCVPSQPSAPGLAPGSSCTANSQCASQQCNLYTTAGVQACSTSSGCICGAINPFSGGLYARTGCQRDGTNCQAGDCKNAPYQPCPLGEGAGNPASQAEFTLSEYSQDFYDVTLINGANSAIEMAPDSNSTPAPVIPGASSDYWCQTPGGHSQQGALPGCPWDFVTTDVNGADETTLLTQISLPACSDPTATNPPSNQAGCPLGSTCQPNGADTFYCMPNLKACTSSSQCPGSMPCVGGFCSPFGQCASESDCPPGSACVNGLCDGAACSSNSDCSGKGLESATCLNETVIPATPAPSSSATPAPAPTPTTAAVCVPLTCDLPGVSCPTGFSCSTASGPGTCQPQPSCSLTNPCPSSRQSCDIASGKCVITPYCGLDGGCPAGYVCGENDVCLPGAPACAYSSTNDSYCPDGSACPSSGLCPGACASDADCTSVAGTCVGGSCRPLTWDINTSCPTGYSQLPSPSTSCVLTCGSASDCTNSQYGNVCGNAQYNGNLIQTCGASNNAVWSMDDFCGNAPTGTFAGVDCGAIAQSGPGDTFAKMFGCNGSGTGSAVSCYNDPNNYSTCCGCPTFPNDNSASWPTPWNLTVASLSCQNTTNNSTWIGDILPWLQYLKAACPTAYSFPFDDATSTFECESLGTFLPTPNPSSSATPAATPAANVMNYDVTFSAIGINATPSAAPTP